MDELMMKILELVITVAIAVITRYLVPYIKTKIETEKINEVMRWVAEFVDAAEQVYGAKTGKTKKEFVVDAIKKQCEDLGINITEAQIEALIESAVFDLKLRQKKQVQN